MATTINAGRVRFVSRGTYNNSTQYYLFDLVDYNGSSYIAKENTVGNLPTNTQYWQLIAEKGNTGSTGQPGATGATGNGIASITKTGTSGLVDTYTITFTNGTTTTFEVTNGEDGEVTQAQFDDLEQRVEDAENNQLTNTPTPATSHYLQDSADSRFRKFIPIGRSVQDGDPTPENSVPIKNTGDNGSVNEKMQNKNLLPFNNQDFTLNSVRYYVQDGNLYFNGTSTSETSSNNTNFKNNFNFTLEAGTYKISHKTGVNVVYLYNYDNDSTSLVTLGTDTANQTFTLTKKTRLYIGFYVYQKTFNNINTEIMIEQGSTASDYVPHSEQNLSFPLSQGQKFYEGSHPDDDEKVHHKMGEYVFTGNETFTRDKELTNSYRFYTPSNTIPNSISGTSISTHFKNSTVNNISNVDEQALTVMNQNQITLRINKTLASTVQELKDLLAEWYTNGNPLKVQFHRVTPVEEDFTEEQQTAWEQIKKARTYKNITHISSEDETPANVEIEYVVDINTIDDRITALEAKVDLLEE